MKLHVAVLSVLAATLAGGPLMASAADTGAWTPTASTAKHHHAAKHHTTKKHSKSSTESQSATSK